MPCPSLNSTGPWLVHLASTREAGGHSTFQSETIRSRNHDERARMVPGCEVTSAVSGQNLIGKPRGSGGKFVLELLWKAAIPQLSNDSSVHRVRVYEHTGWLTDDDEIEATFDNTWVGPERCSVKIGHLPPKVVEAVLGLSAGLFGDVDERRHSAWIVM